MTHIEGIATEDATRHAAIARDPLLNVEQVAEYTRLSIAYLNRLRHTGGGCRFSKVGTRCLYRLSDIDAWVNSKRRTSTADDGRK